MSASVDTVLELFDLGPLEIKPPIYLAGDWTHPPYALTLMEPDLDHEGLYGWTYSLEVTIPVGNHRYRYWAPVWGDWIWNEAMDTECDDRGDEYNIINVPSSIRTGDRFSENCLLSQSTSSHGRSAASSQNDLLPRSSHHPRALPAIISQNPGAGIDDSRFGEDRVPHPSSSESIEPTALLARFWESLNDLMFLLWVTFTRGQDDTTESNR